MESVLFMTYLGCVSAIGINFMKMKFQIDLEESVKTLREYDLANERIKVDYDRLSPDEEFIVLATHKGVPHPKKKTKEGEAAQQSEQVQETQD